MATEQKSNAARITPEKMVTILRNIGSASVSLEIVQADIAAGFPVNDDGSINIEKYAAWLNKEYKEKRWKVSSNSSQD